MSTFDPNRGYAIEGDHLGDANATPLRAEPAISCLDKNGVDQLLKRLRQEHTLDYFKLRERLKA